MAQPRLRIELDDDLVTRRLLIRGLQFSWFILPDGCTTVWDFAYQLLLSFRLRRHTPRQLSLTLGGFALPLEAPVQLLRDGDLVRVSLLRIARGPRFKATASPSCQPATETVAAALPGRAASPSAPDAPALQQQAGRPSSPKRPAAARTLEQAAAKRPRRGATARGGGGGGGGEGGSGRGTDAGAGGTAGAGAAAGAGGAAGTCGAAGGLRAEGDTAPSRSRSARRKAEKRRLRRLGVLPKLCKGSRQPGKRRGREGVAPAQPQPAPRPPPPPQQQKQWEQVQLPPPPPLPEEQQQHGAAAGQHSQAELDQWGLWYQWQAYYAQQQQQPPPPAVQQPQPATEQQRRAGGPLLLEAAAMAPPLDPNQTMVGLNKAPPQPSPPLRQQQQQQQGKRHVGALDAAAGSQPAEGAHQAGMTGNGTAGSRGGGTMGQSSSGDDSSSSDGTSSNDDVISSDDTSSGGGQGQGSGEVEGGAGNSAGCTRADEQRMDVDSSDGSDSDSSSSSSSSSSEEDASGSKEGSSSSSSEGRNGSGSDGAGGAGGASAGASVDGEQGSAGGGDATPAEPSTLPELGRPPCPGDVVSYRLLELGPSFSPQVSGFRHGQVESHDPNTGVLVVRPWPRGSTHPLASVMRDAAKAAAAAAAAAGDEEEDAAAAAEAASAQLLGASEYDEQGLLHTSLGSLVEVRLVRAAAGSNTHQGSADVGGAAARSAQEQQQQQRQRPHATAGDGHAAGATAVGAASGGTVPLDVLGGGCDRLGNGTPQRVSPGLGPPRPAGAGGNGGGRVIPAVGAWKDIAEQLRRKRQQLQLQQPPPLPQQPPLQERQRGQPPTEQHGTGGNGSGIERGKLGAGEPAQRVARSAAAGVVARGVMTPGATKPRGGVRRAAVGPLLEMLRAQQPG